MAGRLVHLCPAGEETANQRRMAVAMKTPDMLPLVRSALLALAAIKAAVEASDRGDANAFDVLDAIGVAVDAQRRLADVCRVAAEPSYRIASVLRSWCGERWRERASRRPACKIAPVAQLDRAWDF